MTRRNCVSVDKFQEMTDFISYRMNNLTVPAHCDGQREVDEGNAFKHAIAAVTCRNRLPMISNIPSSR